MGLPEDVRVITRMHDHVEVHPMNLNDAFGAMQALFLQKLHNKLARKTESC